MPQSKNRRSHNAHHQQVHPHNTTKSKKQGRATVIAIIFLAALGLGISYFIAGDSPAAMLTGIAAGAVAGYFFGRQIETSFSKK